MAFQTYADVTGVVDGTAAGEVAALGVLLLAAIPDPDTAPANQGVVGHLDQMTPVCASQLRAEITALLAAVAAAPTV